MRQVINCKHVISFHVLEFWTTLEQWSIIWSYPHITNEIRNYLESNRKWPYQQPCWCIRSGSQWLHCCPLSGHTSEKLNQISTESMLVLVTDEFEPIKYGKLLEVFTDTYRTNNNFTDLVRTFLSVCSFSKCKANTVRCNLINDSCEPYLQGIVKHLDADFIYILLAILLKRRCIVYHKDVQQLQRFLLGVCNMVPSRIRNYNEFLFPLMTDLREIKGLSFFIAGIVDRKVVPKYEYSFDILVDLNRGTIRIAPHAKDVFQLTPTYAELSSACVTLAALSEDEQQLRDKLCQACEHSINSIHALATTQTEVNVKMISMADLKEGHWSPNEENFLFNLALAEKLMIL